MINEFIIQHAQSNNSYSKFTALCEDGALHIDTTYMVDDLPRTRISCTASMTDILELYAKIDTILNNHAQNLSLALSNHRSPAKNIILAFGVSGQSMDDHLKYRVRVEDMNATKFVQVDLEADQAYGLRKFLDLVLVKHAV